MSTNKITKLALAAIAIALTGGCQASQDLAPAHDAPAAGGKARPLTAAHLEALQNYDRNADGQLDLVEQQRMEAERKARIDALKARINARYDRNGNGVLEPDEQRTLQADRDRLSHFKGRALRRYDTNHDGVLDPDERRRMVAERKAFLGDMKGKLLARFDANHDGKLDRQERLAMDQQLAPKASPLK